jgi:hypothetical protein
VAEEWTSDGWQRKGAVPFAVSGQQMELALPSAWFDDPERFAFKWADNLQRDGAVEEFSISGDAAPNRRFKYAFELRADP